MTGKYAILLLLSCSLSAQTRQPDWKVWAVSGAYLGVTVADIEATQHCIHTGMCQEGNVLAPSSRAGAYAESAAINGLNIWLAWKLKKDGSRMWFILPSVGIAAHSYGFYTGLKLR